ncbi:hypothetical protein [Allosalinactinospora lopnorensis]|uniref:hypothetical protein n=1 Tax=Allosalinactinospora lopnorensis TaxID=1352348 RepID=UPI000623F055|nr:hypothetical protein [Allosalinactinospora lopnorensis]
MGFALYIENQLHDREYTGAVHSRNMTAVLEKAEAGSQLSYVHPHGDTMFNVPQMHRIKQELGQLRDAHPELDPSIEALEILINKAILDRGYLWISGD